MSDTKYYVWAFRRSQECYDCGAIEKIDAEPNASAVELTAEQFDAFLIGAGTLRWNSEYAFLYRRVDDAALTPRIMELVERGMVEVEEKKKREEAKKQKAAEKAARASELASKKAAKEAEQERKLYAKLKEKFEK